VSGRLSHGLWFDTLGPDRKVFVAETCHLGADQRRSKEWAMERNQFYG